MEAKKYNGNTHRRPAVGQQETRTQTKKIKNRNTFICNIHAYLGNCMPLANGIDR